MKNRGGFIDRESMRPGARGGGGGGQKRMFFLFLSRPPRSPIVEKVKKKNVCVQTN